MKLLTEEDLLRFAPRAKPEYITALVRHQNLFTFSALARCHFLAQTAHETGGYTIDREWTTWTPAQFCKLWPHRFKSRFDPRILACGTNSVKKANLAYGGKHRLAKALGNTKDPDDGYSYRGGGFLQTTGRENYRKLGNIIGVPLEENPSLIETPEVSLKAAIAEWDVMGCTAFADRNQIHAVSNAINAGNPYRSRAANGFEDRKQWFERAFRFFGEGVVLPDTSVLSLGSRGDRVRHLQGLLRERGYPVGTVDGVFGKRTAHAVLAFKMDDKRETWPPQEIVDANTLLLIEDSETQLAVSEERQETTEKELAALGSTEVAAGKSQKRAATLLTLGAVGHGASTHPSMFAAAQDSIGILPQWHSFLTPVIAAVQWGLANFFWIVALILGAWVWSGGHKTVVARVRAHVRGWNVWR
ncbi:MAG: peptidoglycan-binding protein [Pseudomonadota bacterium]